MTEATLDRPAHTGVMSEINESGDTKIIWNKDNADEVENARASFERLVTKGKFAAFNVGVGGRKAGKIEEFDPDAEKIILVPQIVGG